jgi:hypothetical protein
VLARLVARDWDNDVASYGHAVKIPIRGTVSANAKAADTAITLNAPTDTNYTVTLDQHYEVSFIIEDVARLQARPDYLNGYIAEGCGQAEQSNIDGAILPRCTRA